jgi:hypothetical protein
MTFDKLMDLIQEYANTVFDCGDWRDSDDQPYTLRYLAERQAKKALADAVQELITERDVAATRLQQKVSGQALEPGYFLDGE